MRHYDNIERSAFRHGQYVGWDCLGKRYAIKKDGPRKSAGSWWVYGQEDGCIPIFYAGTLAVVSIRLRNRSAICAVPRLPHEAA